MKRLIAFFLCAVLLALPASAAASYGVDIYHGDTEYDSTNWKLLAQEKSFVYIKATEGAAYKDPMFSQNRAGAKSVGMRWGPYHFLRLYSASSCAAQADFFWSQIKGTGYTLIPAVDAESYDGQGTSAGIRACLSAFLDEFYRDSGVHPVIYSYTAYIRNNSLARYYGASILWQADYAGRAQDVGWPYAVWQYRGSGSVAAMSGGVDLDLAVSGRFALKYNIYTTTAKPVNNAVARTKLQVYDANGNLVDGYAIPANTWIRINYYTSTFWEAIWPSGTHWTHGYISTGASLRR